MSLQVIKFEPVSVVTRKNPNWLAEQFGSFPSVIDLALTRFPDHSEWPEYDPSKGFGIVWFPGEIFKDWLAVDERLRKEGFGPDRRTYPFHLARVIVPQCDELWRRWREGKGPRWIYASSSESFWCRDDGHLCVPYVDVEPDYREVDARWVENGFGDNDGFLISLPVVSKS